MEEYKLKHFGHLADGEVLQAVRQNLGLESENASKDEQIRAMSPDELFERFMTWNGIKGFENPILEAINDIRDAFATTRAPDEWPYNSDFLW